MEPVAYYIIHHAQQAGPFTHGQLQEMIATGKIGPEQPGWVSGMTEWRPLHEFLPQVMPKTITPPVTFSMVMPVQPVSKKSSKVWLWATLAVLVAVGGAGALIGRGAYVFLKKGTAEMAYVPLQEERAGHESQWQRFSLKPTGRVELPNRKSFLSIHYHSPAGELSAYLTPDPKDGKRHPAIVWAHSFSKGIGSMFWQHDPDGHDLTARAFRDKGIVMMCPSWRGENENPGRMELHYGEVDDFLAAIQHIKKLPYVDPNRVYIGGHDAGGTLALLAACASDQFEAAFSLGGMLDGAAMLKRLPRNHLPFDPDSPQEYWLRSPLRYASFIRRPVFYFEANDSFELDAARRMKERAGTCFQAFQLGGNHFNIVPPITYLIAEKIAANQEISFTANELTDRNFQTLAFKASLRKPPDQNQEAYGLSSILAKAESHPLIARGLNENDLSTLRGVMESLIEQKDYSPKAFAAVSQLSDLRNKVRDISLLQTYNQVLAPLFSQWALQRVKAPAEMTKAEEDCIMAIMIVHGGIPTNFAGAELTAAAFKRGLQPDSFGWYQIYGIYNVQAPLTGHLMSTLALDPPSEKTGKALTYINLLSQQGWEGNHPYNSARGLAILQSWVQSRNPEHLSLASEAARTAAYLKAEFRDALLPIALQHPQASVRVSAAWADVKNGGAQGLPLLRAACMDVHQSVAAQGFLKNLLLEGEIPLEVRDPGFLAKSTVALTLADKSLLGKPPLSIDIYDHKNLFWPPLKQKCDIWVLRFTFAPEEGGPARTGYALHSQLVNWYSWKGNVTSTVPEDLYLHACADEVLNTAKRRNVLMAREEAWKQALMALRENNPGTFDSISIPGDDRL